MENRVYKTWILATIKTKIHSTFKQHVTKSSKFKHLNRNPFKLTLKLCPLKLTHSLAYSQAVRSPPFVAHHSYPVVRTLSFQVLGSLFLFFLYAIFWFVWWVIVNLSSFLFWVLEILGFCSSVYCKFECFSLSFVFVFVFVLFFPINSLILVIGNCFIRKGFLFIVWPPPNLKSQFNLFTTYGLVRNREIWQD